MKIDFKNEEIVGTTINLTMINKKNTRPDDWSVENELALMSYMLQVKLINQNLMGIHGSAKEHWRSNLMNFMNETLDKFEDTGHLQYDFELSSSDEINTATIYEVLKHGSSKFLLNAIDKDSCWVYTPEYIEECNKEELRVEAVRIAKAQLIEEQRLRDEQEAEQEAEREANTIKVIQPIKGYLKHAQ